MMEWDKGRRDFGACDRLADKGGKETANWGSPGYRSQSGVLWFVGSCSSLIECKGAFAGNGNGG